MENRLWPRRLSRMYVPCALAGGVVVRIYFSDSLSIVVPLLALGAACVLVACSWFLRPGRDQRLDALWIVACANGIGLAVSVDTSLGTSTHTQSISIALLVALGAIPTYIGGRLVMRVLDSLFIRRRAFWREGLCAECGYDLTGNTSGACPECGKPCARSEQTVVAEEDL